MKNNKCEGIISIRTALMPRGGSEKVFQTEFFHLIEQLDLGDKAGVGGGVFAPFLTADKLKNFLESGMNLVGVRVTQHGVEIKIVLLPGRKGLLGKRLGLRPLPALGQGFGSLFPSERVDFGFRRSRRFSDNGS